jgi:hypothetical protein
MFSRLVRQTYMYLGLFLTPVRRRGGECFDSRDDFRGSERQRAPRMFKAYIYWAGRGPFENLHSGRPSDACHPAIQGNSAGDCDRFLPADDDQCGHDSRKCPQGRSGLTNLDLMIP